MTQEAIKERLKVNLEKFRLAVTVIVLITSGLIGLLFKDTDTLLKRILFAIGLIWDIVLVIYVSHLNSQIEELLVLTEN